MGGTGGWGMGDGGWGMGKGESKKNEKGVLRSPLSFFRSFNDYPFYLLPFTFRSHPPSSIPIQPAVPAIR
jgi:hypothetical protein